MVHSEIARNRGAGAGTAKKIQCHRNETILQLRERGITNYETQKGTLALAPQKKIDSIVTRQFCNCTKEALRATLVDATGTVRLSLSVWSECREMRISGAHYLRVQLLCCCQRESKTSSVAKLFLSLERKLDATGIAMKTCLRVSC